MGVSIPNFWMGPLLILGFSLGLGWFPVSGRDAPGSLVLPALTLGTSMAAILSPLIMTTTFAAFTAEGSGVFFPGAPFVLSAVLLGFAVVVIRRTPRATTP